MKGNSTEKVKKKYEQSTTKYGKVRQKYVKRRWEHLKRFPIDLYLGPTIPLGLVNQNLTFFRWLIRMQVWQKGWKRLRSLNCYQYFLPPFKPFPPDLTALIYFALEGGVGCREGRNWRGNVEEVFYIAGWIIDLCSNMLSHLDEDGNALNYSLIQLVLMHGRANRQTCS